MLGLGSKKDDKPADDAAKNDEKQKAANTNASDEAQELLKKMEAKKEAGDCPFC